MSDLRQMLEGAAIAAVLQERVAQCDRYGHDPLAERELPPHYLTNRATEFGKSARDRSQPGSQQHLIGARKKAVQAAALWLAAIDVLDHHIAAQITPLPTAEKEA